MHKANEGRVQGERTPPSVMYNSAPPLSSHLHTQEEYQLVLVPQWIPVDSHRAKRLRASSGVAPAELFTVHSPIHPQYIQQHHHPNGQHRPETHTPSAYSLNPGSNAIPPPPPTQIQQPSNEHHVLSNTTLPADPMLRPSTQLGVPNTEPDLCQPNTEDAPDGRPAEGSHCACHTHSGERDERNNPGSVGPGNVSCQ